VSRAEFVEYLCEHYKLEHERINTFGGANVACYSLCAGAPPACISCAHISYAMPSQGPATIPLNALPHSSIELPEESA
jgi:hypothetical protein